MSSTFPHMAWVVFSDNSDLPLLRFLKKGFRHCYVVLSDGQKWFSIDPMAHRTEIMFHQFTPALNLPLWLKSQGYSVVHVGIETPDNKPAPLMISTCVETVKRLLGIHNRLIITPWQLYCYLLKNKHT